jgi:hypothetical protein
VPSDHNTTRIFEGPRKKNFQKKNKFSGEDPLDPLAAAADVDWLAADFACTELDLLSFYFQARYPHVFIPTPPLTSGRANVVRGPDQV